MNWRSKPVSTIEEHVSPDEGQAFYGTRYAQLIKPPSMRNKFTCTCDKRLTVAGQTCGNGGTFQIPAVRSPTLLPRSDFVKRPLAAALAVLVAAPFAVVTPTANAGPGD